LFLLFVFDFVVKTAQTHELMDSWNDYKYVTTFYNWVYGMASEASDKQTHNIGPAYIDCNISTFPVRPQFLFYDTLHTRGF
jgi:hypothetical protein